MHYNSYILIGLFFYFFSYIFYLKISHGLGNKATFLQMRRFIPCAILAVLPAWLSKLPLTDPLFFIPAIIALLWIVTYPTLYFITNHKVSSDFEFHFEAVFGLYTISWLTSIGLIVKYISSSYLSVICTILFIIIELLLLIIPLAQIAYFTLYKSCINENGMQMLQETDYNEVIEFFKSLPWFFNLIILLITITLTYILTYSNYLTLVQNTTLDYLSLSIMAAITIFLTIYLWKKNHGVFIRTAIAEFYLDIKNYRETNMLYNTNLKERYEQLSVKSLGKPFAKPSTIILVIGESASRDYMQVFNPAYPYDTTPWLKQKQQEKNFILFPNAYSTVANTVMALSKSLTEMNQYNDKLFYQSCSIVDIAHKAGYKVHWYSNQGHLGSADTPVTLIADTADVAKWTKQELNTVQYDESLIKYLDEVDPQNNNFVVLHLIGNHFNFLNRFPQKFTKFGVPGKYDLELNYADSLAYTDFVLEQIFNYAKKHLNLQAMVYFSDHATIPDKRRSPNFEGLAVVRIPLFTYFSDEYIACNPNIFSTLQKHKDYYWTNDLAYELICSIFNIESNKFAEDYSLASPKFKFKREDLRTNNGQTKI